MNTYLDIIDQSSEGILRIRQGVGVIVFNTALTQVYLSERRGGGEFNGLWQNPGGKLEIGESPNAGAARELKEETGLSRLFLPHRNFLTTLGKNKRGHYLFHWFFTVLDFDEVLERSEPEQNSDWHLYPIEHLKGIPMMPFLHKATIVAHALVKGTCER